MKKITPTSRDINGQILEIGRNQYCQVEWHTVLSSDVDE